MMDQDYQKVKNSGFATYHEAAGSGPPRPTLLAALDGFGPVAPGSPPLAVDLGCGTGRDTLELLRRGWRVLAVDSDPQALAALQARAAASGLPAPGLLAERLESVALPPCSLVNASFCLFLCAPEAFGATWQRLREALLPGGRLACQLLGPRDDWAGREGIGFHDRREVEALLAGLEVELLEEEESEAVTPRGRRKRWHLWHVVARRPLPATLSASRG